MTTLDLKSAPQESDTSPPVPPISRRLRSKNLPPTFSHRVRSAVKAFQNPPRDSRSTQGRRSRSSHSSRSEKGVKSTQQVRVISGKMIVLCLAFFLIGCVAANLPRHATVFAHAGLWKHTAHPVAHNFMVYDDGGMSSDQNFDLALHNQTSVLLDVMQDGYPTPFTFTVKGDTKNIVATKCGNGILATQMSPEQNKSIVVTVAFISTADSPQTRTFRVSD